MTDDESEKLKTEIAIKPKLHTCPFQECVWGDYETLCDCDEAKTTNCLDSI